MKKHVYVFSGGPMTGKSILASKLSDTIKIEDDFIVTKASCSALIADMKAHKRDQVIVTYDDKLAMLSEYLKSITEDYDITICDFRRIEE